MPLVYPCVYLFEVNTNFNGIHRNKKFNPGLKQINGLFSTAKVLCVYKQVWNISKHITYKHILIMTGAWTNNCYVIDPSNKYWFYLSYIFLYMLLHMLSKNQSSQTLNVKIWNWNVECSIDKNHKKWQTHTVCII